MQDAEEDRTASGDPLKVAPVHPMDALLESQDYELEAPRRGEIRTGTIARITETDVLVDIGAKSEGVISARELEQLSTDQRAMLGVGKEISVYVLRSGGGAAPELSLARADEERDWLTAEELLGSQAIFEGEVSGFNKGGLIVNLG